MWAKLAILQLVDQGILSLNQTVGQMDLGLAAKFPQIAGITLERLLAMASGIPDYANDPQNSVIPIVLKDPQHYFTPDALITAGLSGNISKPGDTGYSTTNYIILGEILAKKTKKSLEEAVTDVCRALGMSESTLPAPEIFLHKCYNYSEFTLVNQWTRTCARFVTIMKKHILNGHVSTLNVLIEIIMLRDALQRTAPMEASRNLNVARDVSMNGLRTSTKVNSLHLNKTICTVLFHIE
jgi:CubicO group peptidase (beta-lactamase class C family)